ncbi:tubulin-specific chaperone D-like [Homalodisca vitripennis]|uniref:tubulin-specific chaperone D-like n=1 Tax=Homalodisca vitripennis TaxID=197043 RepID=UPI001EEB5EFD|nr:tubulin-specific chaperone D-like [Homalodisca vitripennis]
MLLKHGERQDLLPHASRILRCVVAKHCTDSTLTSKFVTKIITRIGLIFLRQSGQPRSKMSDRKCDKFCLPNSPPDRQW